MCHRRSARQSGAPSARYPRETVLFRNICAQALGVTHRRLIAHMNEWTINGMDCCFNDVYTIKHRHENRPFSTSSERHTASRNYSLNQRGTKSNGFVGHRAAVSIRPPLRQSVGQTATHTLTLTRKLSKRVSPAQAYQLCGAVTAEVNGTVWFAYEIPLLRHTHTHTLCNTKATVNGHYLQTDAQIHS